MIDVVVREVRRIPVGEAVVQKRTPGFPDSFGPPTPAQIDPATIYAEHWTATPEGSRFLVKINGREFMIRASDNKVSVMRAIRSQFVEIGKLKRGDFRVYVPLPKRAPNPRRKPPARPLAIRTSYGLAESYLGPLPRGSGISKWIASCDTHGKFINTRGEADAKRVAQMPWSFCDECRSGGEGAK